MAEGKKSVLLYCDILHTVEQLDNETAGELFKHYLRYINDMNPETNNVLVKIAFEPIKQNLKRDLVKWEERQQEKSLNGRMGNLKRYNLDLYELVVANKLDILEAEKVAKSRKASLSDNLDSEAINDVAKVAVKVKDNVNVTVNVKDINNKVKYIPISEFENILIEENKIQEFQSMYEKQKLDFLIKKLDSWLETKKKKCKGIKSFKAYCVNWVLNTYEQKPIQSYQNNKNVQPEPQKRLKITKIQDYD